MVCPEYARREMLREDDPLRTAICELNTMVEGDGDLVSEEIDTEKPARQQAITGKVYKRMAEKLKAQSQPFDAVRLTCFSEPGAGR